MPTRRGVALLVGAVLAWGVGRLLGVSELYLVAVAAAALVAAAVVWVQTTAGSVAVRRRLDAPRAQLGEEREVGLDVRDDGRLPSGLLLLEDRRPAQLLPAGQPTRARFTASGLRPGEVRSFTHGLRAAARGRWAVGPVTLRVRDPFGIAEHRRSYRTTSELLVYPRVTPLPAVPLPRAARRGAGQRRRPAPGGDEFHALRPYQDGDDLRSVHWPSTARRGQLMVRQDEQPWSAESATVVLDTQGPLSSADFEDAVGAAASVAAHLARRRHVIRLMAGGTRGVAASAPLETHLARLAEVVAGEGPPLAEVVEFLRAAAAPGLLVVVVGDAAEALRPLHALGRSTSARVALVVGDQAEHRAAELASLGWHAAPVDGEPSEAWMRALRSNRAEARA